MRSTVRSTRTAALALASTAAVVAGSPLGAAAQTAPPSTVPPTTAPPTTAPSSNTTVVPVDGGEPVPGGPIVANAFAYHSTQREASANVPILISGSGGNGYRQLMVKFSQDTYRDVGVLVVGTKTIASAGWSNISEVSGSAAAPDGGSIEDQNTCSAVGVTGLTVGLPASAKLSTSTNSVTASWRDETGSNLSFQHNYWNAFQCRAPSATPVKNTRRVIGSMRWKNGSLQGQSGDAQYWW